MTFAVDQTSPSAPWTLGWPVGSPRGPSLSTTGLILAPLSSATGAVSAVRSLPVTGLAREAWRSAGLSSRHRHVGAAPLRQAGPVIRRVAARKKGPHPRSEDRNQMSRLHEAHPFQNSSALPRLGPARVGWDAARVSSIQAFREPSSAAPRRALVYPSARSGAPRRLRVPTRSPG